MALCPFCSAELPTPTASEPALTACPECVNALILEPKAGQWEAGAVPGRVDVRQATLGGSFGHDLVQALQAALDEVPALPEIAQQVLSASHDPQVGMNEMADLLGSDPVLAVKVLRLANSALYAGISEVKDLRSACARLGMKQIVTAAQTVAFSDFYKSAEPKLTPILHRLWRHSVATAYCAQNIARIVAQPAPDVLFMAGLVHDVGGLTALTAISKPERPSLHALSESPQLLSEVVSAWHPLLGLHAVRHWGLPNELAVAAFFHNTPDTVPYPEWLPLAHIVCLASTIANLSGFNTWEKPEVSLVSLASSRFLALNDLKLAMIQVDLEDHLEAILNSLAAE